MTKHREQPIKRMNPSGKTVWKARYTNSEGRRVSAGTFKTKREAQDAIDKAYGIVENAGTLGAYFKTWTRHHPRSQRTNDTNEHRIGRVLNVPVEGRKLRDWPYVELRRRHAQQLVAVLLVDQGRSALGATHILRALSAMTEDAITDEIADVNPFKGVRVRANDPRIRKQPREVRVWTFEQMHDFAAAAGEWEPMVRTFADTGMRLGEVIALHRADLVDSVFTVRRTAHKGALLEGTKTDHGEQGAGRMVPCPPGLAAMIKAAPTRIDTLLLFPTKTGRVWQERNFYRDVWYPAQEASDMDVRPHEMRHSFVTHCRAAGIDDADLAEIAGHTVQTMIGKYTHALRKSFDDVRRVVG